jgi:hypothetical protein
MSKKKVSAHPAGPGVWMPKSTLDSPAWKALSDGSQRLYIALKLRADVKHNTSYMSAREAGEALGRLSFRKIREWYAELEHYGFIVMLTPHALGSDGHGKAAHWRLADKGTVRGGFEPPKQEFLKWDGVLFDPAPFREKRAEVEWPKTESRNHYQQQGAAESGSSPATTSASPNEATAADGGCIHEGEGAATSSNVTSINHLPGPQFGVVTTPSEPRKPVETDFGPNKRRATR